MRKIKTKIHVEAGYSLPNYQSKDAAGCDLLYCGEQPITLLPLDRVFIKSGVSIQLPEGYEAQVRSRSGLNKKHGIVCITGTIDSDYRGDIGIVNIANSIIEIYKTQVDAVRIFTGMDHVNSQGQLMVGMGIISQEEQKVIGD